MTLCRAGVGAQHVMGTPYSDPFRTTGGISPRSAGRLATKADRSRAPVRGTLTSISAKHPLFRYEVWNTRKAPKPVRAISPGRRRVTAPRLAIAKFRNGGARPMCVPALGQVG